MVHHYQKNSKRSFDLDERTLWTLQERQAIYYQNLFLISQKRKNDNKGPENVIQCEGGSYLIFSMSTKALLNNFIKNISPNGFN